LVTASINPEGTKAAASQNILSLHDGGSDLSEVSVGLSDDTRLQTIPAAIPTITASAT
jgi:hypothetical protein